MAHLHDVKVPRNKVKKVKRALIAKYPQYVPFFNVCSHRNGPSVCTLVKQEYTPGLTVLHTPPALDGRLLAIRLQGFGAETPTLVVNTYQWVNSPPNQPLAVSLLDQVYSLARSCLRRRHHMVWSGDLNAVLQPQQRINYADTTIISKGIPSCKKWYPKWGPPILLAMRI